jgi:hypothetical protein
MNLEGGREAKGCHPRALTYPTPLYEKLLRAGGQGPQQHVKLIRRSAFEVASSVIDRELSFSFSNVERTFHIGRYTAQSWRPADRFTPSNLHHKTESQFKEAL